MASYAGQPELGIPEGFDMSNFGSSAPQGQYYPAYSPYGYELPPEEFGSQGSLQDQSYYDCITSLNDLRNDEASFDLLLPQYDPMQRQPSTESDQTIYSHVSSGPADQQTESNGNNSSNDNTSPDADTRSASRTERRRAQNREAQRAFRTRRNYSLQMASQKLRDSVIEIRSLRHEKDMYEQLAQQRELWIRSLEKKIEIMKAECVCGVWRPSMGGYST